MTLPAGGDLLTGDWWRPLLGFWFGSLTREQWFKRSDALDQELRERFAATYEAVAASQLRAEDLGARGSLAAVIALDQIPRNIFRGTPHAFATDRAARGLALQAIDLGFDTPMTMHERLFVYLPLEHSEDLADQEMSVDLMSGLGDAEYTRFAIAHRAIIARFGRFPHRNDVLGRRSTPEEIAFLSQPGSSF